MSTVSIGALNCRGLSEDVKRRDFFHKYRKKFDVIILTDTHSTKDKEKQWYHEWGYKSFFSSHTSHSRGVAILFNNTFAFSIFKEIKDDEGNFVILDLCIQECRMTLVPLYGPNEDSPTFFKKKP